MASSTFSVIEIEGKEQRETEKKPTLEPANNVKQIVVVDTLTDTSCTGSLSSLDTKLDIGHCLTPDAAGGSGAFFLRLYAVLCVRAQQVVVQLVWILRPIPDSGGVYSLERPSPAS